MGIRTRHHLLTVEKEDKFADLPEQWRENNEAIDENIDRLEYEIAQLKEEIAWLKKSLSSQ